MTRGKIRLALAGLVAMAAASAAVPAAHAEEKAPAWLRASFVLSSCQKFADEMGLPIPFDQEIRRDIERAPFMGAGSLAGDKPFGLLLFPINPEEGRRIDRQFEKAMVIAVPINKGWATMENLEAYARQNDPNAVVNGDTITSRRMNMRRTADYLFVSPGPLVSQTVNDAFKGDYKPGTLATATLDLAALRKHAPKFLESFWTEIGTEMPRAIAATPLSVLKKQVDALDTATATIWRDDTALRATAVFTPMNVKPTLAAMPRPTFPAGTLFQVHVAYPNAEWAAWAPAAIERIELKDLARKDEVSDTEREQFKDVKTLALRVAKLLSAEAQSCGLIMDGNKPIFLAVNQYAKAPDVAAEIKGLAGDVNAAAKKHGQPKMMEIEEYASGSQKVSRVLLLDNERPAGYIDVAQAGNKVAITISEGKVEKAAALLAAPAKGQLSDFVNASVDLGEVFRAVENQLPLPGEIAKRFHEALADKSVTLVVKSTDDGKSLQAEASVPLAVLKNAGEVLNGMFGRSRKIDSETMPPQPAQ